ncbi:AGC family protein kinase [Histomonas meleagridis]|uniref:AGC family protein kinase n=1 Tax=Histomonas meleagridis TaxID=135588 RepID=UPI003559B6E7|nr:AGC family protein kinase [Histomonas meleagridis]KAH0803757.1 AGC family protein kinase [Histomonas meleagridis]
MSLFVSSLSSLIGDGHSVGQDDVLVFRQVGMDTYSKTYIFLKAQRMVLETVKNDLEKIQAEGVSQSLDYILYLVESLLISDFGGVFQKAKNAIQPLRKFIESEKLPVTVKKQCQKVLSESIALSRVFSIIECTIPSPSEPASEKLQVQVQNPEDILLLCRICEEYVPLSLIESHSKSCVRAYECEFKVMTVDDRISKLQNSIQKTILCHEWPDTEDKCVNTYLPMFHLYLLLEKVRNASTTSTYDANVISLTNQSLRLLKIPNDRTCLPMLYKAKELTIQKLHACSNLKDAKTVSESTLYNRTDKKPSPKQVSITDFEFIKAISSGAYARVFLAIKKKTGDIYAIKVTSKSSLAQKNQIQRLLNEKDILLQNDNPYIVNFYYSFIGKHNLYIVMEYLPGGDLYSLLNNIGSLDETNARIYTVQIVKALQCLHDNGIVHRDLKPDNILITKEGKLKLTDFGLSLYGSTDHCLTNETSNSRIANDNESVVGTPDYLPPEIILSQPHDFTADYWSLGVVVYELVEGIPPFHRNTESETFLAILSNQIDWNHLANDMSSNLISLLKGLLQSDPTKRLGANGIQEIMDHPWFQGIDWEHIDELPAPFIPEISDSFSTEYFDQRYAWKTNDDDIIEDIRVANEQKIDSKDYIDDDLDECISQFPSIDLKKLSQTNNEIMRKMKRSKSNMVHLDMLGYDELQFSKSFCSTNKKRKKKNKMALTSDEFKYIDSDT